MCRPTAVQEVCYHRFYLFSKDNNTRRQVRRWLFLHFMVYEYHTEGPESRGRFISPGRTFPEAAFRDMTYGLRGDETLHIWVISYGLDTIYLERNRYRNGKWLRPERL